MSRISLFALALMLSMAVFANPASAQIINANFEDSAIGTPQSWNFNGNGGGSFISTFDVTMPTQGTRFAVMTGGSNGPATPHSNPGGFGTDASGTVSLSQFFFFPNSSDTTLEFDCILLGNDGVNPDFLEVSISAAGVTQNILHLDTVNDVGPFGALTITGLQSSLLTHVSVDLGATFVGANVTIPFEIKIHLGNSGDNLVAPRAHIDNIQHTPGTPFAVNSVAFKPMPGFVQLSVRTEVPFAEYFTLVSHDTSGPKGGGFFGGLYLDSQLLGILALPLGTAGLHDVTNVFGEFDANVFLGIAPVGFVFDYMLGVLTPQGWIPTTVKRGTWGISEDT